MKITVEMIMKKKPCEEYSECRVKELVGEGKTLLELLALDIPEKDRIWVVTRFLDDKTNRAFAIWCARQCKTDKKEIKNYIDVIEKYYTGKATREELGAADWAADWAAYRAAEQKKQIKKLIEMVKEQEGGKMTGFIIGVLIGLTIVAVINILYRLGWKSAEDHHNIPVAQRRYK